MDSTPRLAPLAFNLSPPDRLTTLHHHTVFPTLSTPLLHSIPPTLRPSLLPILRFSNTIIHRNSVVFSFDPSADNRKRKLSAEGSTFVTETRKSGFDLFRLSSE